MIVDSDIYGLCVMVNKEVIYPSSRYASTEESHKQSYPLISPRNERILYHYGQCANPCS